MVHNHYLFFASCSMGFHIYVRMYELDVRTYVHAICTTEDHRKPSSALRSAIESPYYISWYSAESLLGNSALKRRVLSRLFLGGTAPPIVQIYPPFSVSEAAAPPIIKNDGMRSQSLLLIITKHLYTCKYTVLVCSTIVSNNQNLIVPTYRVSLCAYTSHDF